MMRHLPLLFLLFLVGSLSEVSAQLPNGSIAPDFTATDIDGVEWNLYELLDGGTTVIIDFFATWCGPCWSYSESGALEEVWEALGPDGTDEVMIFSMESDDGTTAADLTGTGTQSWGDWITGTPFPVFDDCANIFNLFENSYYPVIYTICPNHILSQSGQADAASHIAMATANECAAATLAIDPALFNFTGALAGCLGEPAAVSVSMMNMGTETLTSTTVGMFVDDIQVGFTAWTGDLATYGIVDVVLPDYIFSADTEYELRITGPDLNVENSVVVANFDMGEIATTYIYIEIRTDNWGAETSWVLSDANGDVVQSVAVGTLDNLTDYMWEVEVESDLCYSFTLSDSYGDGMFGSPWGNENGYCNVTSLLGFPAIDFESNPASNIFDYDGMSSFEVLSASLITSIPDVTGSTMGCTDPSAFNYDSEAEINDGSCVFEVACLDIGQEFWAEDFSFGVFPGSVYGYTGDVQWYLDETNVVSGFVLNVPNTIVDPATGTVYGVYSFDVEQINGFPVGVDLSSDLPGVVFGGEQVCLETSGYPIAEGLYTIEVVGEMTISLFNNPFSLGVFTTVFEMEVLANPNPVSGCAYVGALNFNPIASSDDGSCEFSGCTDPLAVNYHPLFNLDDSSCVYDLDGGTNPCPADLNSDEMIGISDLLVLLGEFGSACP